jgi:glutathione S-transferase
MTPVITAYALSPDRGRGLARDMRVRWALEEAGLRYDVRPLSFDERHREARLAGNPFGQIPTYEEGDLVLFESGAIILHIAQQQTSQEHGLLPTEPKARARATAWMFAALNTVEPVILERQTARLLEGGESWAQQRLALIDERIRKRLAELARHLGDAEWLDGGFSAGDLLVVSVLRWLTASGSTLVDEQPNLAAYVARGEARPAFQRAFAAQLALYKASASPEGK